MQDLLTFALSQYGIKEHPGADKNNPEIMKYFKDLGHSWATNDETAWCAAMVSYCCKQMGYEGTGGVNAREYESKGWEPKKPTPGDIVILWRGAHKDELIPGTKLKKGHVGFYLNDDKEYVYMFGGNQGNMACAMAYPKTQLIGYRRLKKL
ncbi:TIGR02594 family protein [Roseivirga sp. UBA838]|uniref:TIGR02594 family protein n=1 Tax=Roseivirga sp. UBA838 TaxID=1947393 RepID=UPI00257A6491|nr:TIGR02594 family protein [Roseivirga sp. UBA838]|tara:strand:- start:10361 stop:10813 length:453 start_codon:yes stop_codon:yes gene_type:complete